MKPQPLSQEVIETLLTAMIRLLNDATQYTNEAHSHICRGEQNTAIGTLMPVEDMLDQVSNLFKAIISMHQYNR